MKKKVIVGFELEKCLKNVNISIRLWDTSNIMCFLVFWFQAHKLIGFKFCPITIRRTIGRTIEEYNHGLIHGGSLLTGFYGL